MTPGFEQRITGILLILGALILHRLGADYTLLLMGAGAINLAAGLWLGRPWRRRQDACCDQGKSQNCIDASRQ